MTPIMVNGKGAGALSINGLGRTGAQGRSIHDFGMNGFAFDRGLVLYLPLYALPTSPMASSDIYGHIATVTGAVWGNQGRTIDGIDDYLNAGGNAVLKPTASFSLLIWVKPVAQNGYIQCMPYTTTWVGEPYFAYRIYYRLNESFDIGWNIAGTRNSVTGAAATAPAGVWYFADYSFDGTTHTLRLNNSAYLSQVDAGAIQYGASPQFSIGTRNVDALGEYGKGDIGEVLFYSSFRTLAERTSIYLATKWRYV